MFYIWGKGFGCVDLPEDRPLDDSDNIAELLKENNWKADVINDLPIYLYQAIEKYRKREHDTVVAETRAAQNVISSKSGKTEMSLMDIILSLRDFYSENHNLFVMIYKQRHSGFNKVNWGRTIRLHQPVLKDRSVIYPYVVNRRKEVNYDEELLVLFFNTLRYINNEYHFRFVVEQPYSLISDKEFKRKLENGAIRKRLNTLRNNYFNEKLVRLWEHLYLFASRINNVHSAKEREEYLLIRDFNVVFEDMVETLLGDLDAPKNLVKQQDGKIVDHLFKGMSLTTSSRQVYYVGDSKYYKEGAVPKGDSLFKQYTYAKNIIQTQIDWYHRRKEHLKYRDELTEGYNITPNFFISGSVRSGYDFMSPELHLQSDEFQKNYQFRNRIFDRDTLFLRMYDINFLFVLYAYISRSESVRARFKLHAKEQFRTDFIKYIDSEHDFYLLQQRNSGDIEAVVDKHFRKLNGKVFCPYERGEDHYGLLMLGLERDAFMENAVLLADLSKDFIIKEYHLGTEPYLYYNGLLWGQQVSRSMALTSALKDAEGKYRRESVAICCYRSREHKDWILRNRLYNVRFNAGRPGAVYRHTQQVFTASFLILYDYNNQSAEAECYTLTGVNNLYDAKTMQKSGYPKIVWNGDEEYLLYSIGDRLDGTISVTEILDSHPEAADGTPLYVYFVEVEDVNV
ncbi:MAG: hypothetical protein NC115_07735 [Bacteroidales bacterium]|nr:hypothetical protein [Bacteroidales bacterium]